ncbi:hypothetical protein [Pseudanabaena sp. 'Roaring Creek']|uniref:hypothetical protein n=1 Tax=Pseudanabaena sp. 'Roaring Creek' TaxID=1681830 RepID=UPI0018D04E34|nr:hypothetical protein [Pseudanabaena sp. 'Roaring Creek']
MTTTSRRYRLDEPLCLAKGITRNKQVWLEEIQPQEKGFLFTEKYRQVSLIKLLKLLPKP